jgi:hypothetical protein
MPEINLQDVPAGLRRRLAAEARREKLGISTLINRVLATEFGVPEGRIREGTYKGGGHTSSTLVVTVSDDVRAELRRRGPGNGGTIRGVVLQVLSLRYGIKPPANDRRRRSE